MARDEVGPVVARPTIRMEGMEYPLLSSKIHAMEMRERTGGLSVLELTLADWISGPDGRAGFGAVGADQPLRLGAQISIYAGDAAAPQEIFSGRVTALESEVRETGAPLFTVLAEDALFRARRTVRRRNFEDSAPADIVRAVAADHGLTPEIRDGLDAPVTLWTQMNESDLGFLRRVLDAVDADAQVVGGALQAGPRAAEARTELALAYPRDILRARVTADLARQVTTETLAGFDPLSGQPVSARADGGALGPGQGQDGKAALDQTFGEIVGHAGVDGALTAAEADAYAAAAFRRRARSFVTVDATTQGDPELRVGAWVALTGLNPAFENVYCVTEATHRFDVADGYRTDFLAESAYLGDAR